MYIIYYNGSNYTNQYILEGNTLKLINLRPLHSRDTIVGFYLFYDGAFDMQI